jgi:hypothetical protein
VRCDENAALLQSSCMSEAANLVNMSSSHGDQPHAALFAQAALLGPQCHQLAGDHLNF